LYAIPLLVFEVKPEALMHHLEASFEEDMIQLALLF
jgi:hypothetical protein